jgi:hypothetical protein
VTKEETANITYVRFHGRNADIWYGQDKEEEDQRHNRYDYLYDKKQLKPWVPRINEASEMTDDVRVYFIHLEAKPLRMPSISWICYWERNHPSIRILSYRASSSLGSSNKNYFI